MLKDRMYYKETADNPIMNIFECSKERNSSHFTALRLMDFLQSYKDIYTTEGRGFIELSKVIYEFENYFDNHEDLIFTATRMVRWKLLEVNTKSPDSLNGATFIRLTPAGSYYLCFLSKKFGYLDLVLQDTPLNDKTIANCLTDLMKQVDNLSGRSEDKYKRIEVRFKRVDIFLEYLRNEENEEKSKINKPVNPIFDHDYSKDIISYFDEDKEWIKTRYKENLIKYHDIYIIEEEKETDINIPELNEVYDNDVIPDK